MSAQPAPAGRLSVAEYLAFDRAAETRSEYLDGELLAMGGASLAHVRIVRNLLLLLEPQLRRRGCEAFSNDLRVWVPATDFFAYPDVVVVCGAPELADEQRDTLLNPTLIIEVLSPSTEGYDRGEKLAQYRHIQSLRDYLLVAQDRPRLDHYARQEDASHWLLTVLDDLDAKLELPSIGSTLAPRDVYDRILG